MSKQQHYVPALRFKLLTGLYDFFLGITFPEKKIKQALLQQGNLKRGYRVLDFGCGTATFLIMAADQYEGIRFSGLDVDEAILKIADKKRKKEILMLI